MAVKTPDNRRDFPGGFPDDPKNAFTAEGRIAEQQDMFTTAAKAVRVNGSAASADASFDATHQVMSVVVADDGREQDVLLERFQVQP